MPVTARVVVLNNYGEMLLVRRSATDPFAPGKWDIPGGHHEDDETLEQAARREALEEVGVQVDDLDLLFATSAMRPGGSRTWLFFTAQLPANQSVTLGDEHDKFIWIKPQQLNNYTDYEILLSFHGYISTNHLLEAL